MSLCSKRSKFIQIPKHEQDTAYLDSETDLELLRGVCLFKVRRITKLYIKDILLYNETIEALISLFCKHVGPTVIVEYSAVCFTKVTTLFQPQFRTYLMKRRRGSLSG